MDDNEEILKKPIILRIVLLGLVTMLPLLFLAMQLYSMQIKNGADYAERAGQQYIRRQVTMPVRGQIFSADGKILAGNVCHYDLTMHPSVARNPRGIYLTSSDMLKTATWLENYIMLRPSDLQNIEALRTRMLQNMSKPITLYENLTEDEIARCEEMTPQIRGVEITPRLERHYDMPGLASHLLGFTRMELLPQQRKTYTEKTMRGVTGLEKRYDKELSGKIGMETVITDPSGFIRERLPASTLKEDGMNLHLTLDSHAQQAAELALEGCKGALVAVNIHSGAVLAMASAPTFDLVSLDSKKYSELASDEQNMPLLNRALSGKYLPGSIMKPLVALSALENKVLGPEDEYTCQGFYALGKSRIACSHRYGHGRALNIIGAIAVSCNPFFINAGILLGVENLQIIYSAAGFGRATGFDIHEALPSDNVGTIPSEATAHRLWKRKWLVADTAFASIGQGAVTVTPLQVAIYTAALGNGGKVYRPYILDEIRTQDGKLLKKTAPELRSTLPVSQENLDIVGNAMIEAVEGRDASASALRMAGIPLAAKTGTAEVKTAKGKTKNAWIICYGPMPNPSFAVACIIENGESGGKTTAPRVVDFLKNWLWE